MRSTGCNTDRERGTFISGSNDACSSSALLRTVAFVPSNQRSKDYGVGILRNRVLRD